MKKILIVEDEQPYLKLLNDQLKSLDYKVMTAANGKIGLDIARKEKPDLILLDIRMPVMDGVTMLQQLREDSWGKDVDVIMLTNLDDSKNISDAMHEKLSRYIVKSESTLASVIAEVNTLLKGGGLK